MDGDGIELVSLEDTVTSFDFDNDDFREFTAWTSGDDGLLVFDENDDNQINRAEDIAFAMLTEADDTDLQALQTLFDSDGNKEFNSSDEHWGKFKIWQDRNRDGIADEGEFQTLSQAGIQSLGLEVRENSQTQLSDGTVVHGLIDVYLSNGEKRSGADVAFAYDPRGVRTSADAQGNLVYEFEDGDIEKVQVLSATRNDFKFTQQDSEWVAAEGNRSANILDAADVTRDTVLSGDDGDDSLLGGTGNDFLIGGAGADTLRGGAGNDWLYADADDFSVNGNVSGGVGFDRLIYQDYPALSLDADSVGIEAVQSGSGDDVIWGSQSSVHYAFDGGAGDDTLTGAGGNDLLIGGDGSDRLNGFDGNDAMFAEEGNDFLDAGAGDDWLNGGRGRNTFNGGKGSDVLVGGIHEDVYLFNRGDGRDIISESSQEGLTVYDRVRFGAGILVSQISTSRVDDNLLIRVDDPAGNANDEIIIYQAFTDDSNLIEILEFDNGESYVFDASQAGYFVDNASVNDAPVVSLNISEQFANTDRRWRFTVPEDLFTDIDGDTLTFSAAMSDGSLLPEWLTFYSAAQHFCGQPPQNTADVLSIQVTATDGKNSVSTDFNLVVNSPDTRSGSERNHHFITEENQSVTIPAADVFSNDNESIPGNVIFGNVENGRVELNAAGDIVFTPDAGYTGETSFTYSTTDNLSGVKKASVSISVSTSCGNAHYLAEFDGIVGTVGNDEISGTKGDDRIIGQKGDDILDGSIGDDTFYYRKGDGNDVIDEFFGSNHLVLLDINPDEITVTRSNRNDAVITIIPTGETVTLEDQFFWNAIETVTFADGSLWSYDDLERNVWISGTDGADNLRGSSEDDRIIGNKGDDTLDGSIGDDTFYYRKGDGNDVIDEFFGSNHLVLMDINPDEITVTRSNRNDAVITVVPTGETITLDDQFFWDAIETVTFADGTQWNYKDLENNVWISGADGDDNLRGSSGDDRIMGNKGDDTLDGSMGDDTFYYRKGDGNDVIDEFFGNNHLVLTDINSDEITVTRLNRNDAVITVIPTGETITLEDQFVWDAIETVTFADGTQWNYEDLENNAWISGTGGDDNLRGGSGDDRIAGNKGDDTLNGSFGDDVLQGGRGNDTLNGGFGNDRYQFAEGDGQDVINQNDVSGKDVLAFDGDISADEIWFRRHGEDLRITIVGSDDQVTVNNWYRGDSYQLDKIETESGVLINSQVNQLVNAMAVFSAPEGVDGVIPQTAKDTLQPVLAQAWEHR
ncbi:calcium-binding protein [Aliamphritea hakodatensis]|uniref:calcium-binding protein n=1 Tax=Aliamphritea hakodatensis TaxID=2895352 RepID=UPI0022FD702A|nr:calcium-binding protein [Aliamphritea hakodatensis]